MEKRHDVYSAEPKYIAKVTKNSTVEGEVSNETNYFDKQWSHDKTNLQQALNLASKFNQEEVKIGVVDTGIDAAHLELFGIVDTTLSKNFIDDNGDGVIDTNDGSALIDVDGHGTHVAGIIATNGLRVNGVFGGNNLNLISLRLVQSEDSANNKSVDLDTLINVIEYAKDKKIEILNMESEIVLWLDKMKKIF